MLSGIPFLMFCLFVLLLTVILNSKVYTFAEQSRTERMHEVD